MAIRRPPFPQNPQDIPQPVAPWDPPFGWRGPPPTIPNPDEGGPFPFLPRPRGPWGGRCPHPEEEILLADDSWIKAKDIRTGDKVKTLTAEGFKEGEYEITHAEIIDNQPRCEVFFKDSKSIISSYSHPYAVEDKGFVDAKDLEVGDHVGDLIVTDTKPLDWGPVVSLSVDEAETYMLKAGSEDKPVAVLSHNKTIGRRPIPPKLKIPTWGKENWLRRKKGGIGGLLDKLRRKPLEGRQFPRGIPEQFRQLPFGPLGTTITQPGQGGSPTPWEGAQQAPPATVPEFLPNLVTGELERTSPSPMQPLPRGPELIPIQQEVRGMDRFTPEQIEAIKNAPPGELHRETMPFQPLPEEMPMPMQPLPEEMPAAPNWRQLMKSFQLPDSFSGPFFWNQIPKKRTPSPEEITQQRIDQVSQFEQEPMMGARHGDIGGYADTGMRADSGRPYALLGGYAFGGSATNLPDYTTMNWEGIGPARFSDARFDPQRIGYADTGMRSDGDRPYALPGGYAGGGIAELLRYYGG